MNPEEFITLGEELVARKTACGCRAAIGRAYYGVLQATVEFMRENGITPPKPQEIHQKTWHDLLNSGVPELANPGSELGVMHGKRILADYRMQNPEPEDFTTADYWVGIAREHYETIRQAFCGPTKQKTIDGIRDYRKKVNRPL